MGLRCGAFSAHLHQSASQCVRALLQLVHTTVRCTLQYFTYQTENNRSKKIRKWKFQCFRVGCHSLVSTHLTVIKILEVRPERIREIQLFYSPIANCRERLEKGHPTHPVHYQISAILYVYACSLKLFLSVFLQKGRGGGTLTLYIIYLV